MYKCKKKKNAQIEWLRKEKKNIYKQKNKMLYSKIHKKISLGEYSSLRKKKNHFNLGNHKKTLGVKQKKGNKEKNKGSKGMLMVIQA